MNRLAVRAWISVMGSGGCLLAGGCGAVIERGLDIVLSPGATQNALALVTSALRPLVAFLTNLA